MNFIDLKEYFQEENDRTVDDLYLKNDSHLSRRGTKFVAEIISEKLTELETK